MTQFFTEPQSRPCVTQSTISLNDCLACSGCITPDEAAKFAPDTSFFNDRTTPLAFILSVHAKQSIYAQFPGWDYGTFESALVGALHQLFNTACIVDTSYFAKDSKHLISSECPAVVLYVERVFPALIRHLSTEKTYQQTACEFIRKSGAGLAQDGCAGAEPKIVSVMQCYDKKDEALRDGTKIDYFIGTRDLYEFIKDKLDPSQGRDLQPWERSHGYAEAEVSGIETCINILKGLNKGTGAHDGPLELRICKGGCLHGGAQVEGGNPPSDRGLKMDSLHKVHYSAGRRSFKPRKKNVFDVEW
ncbi:hypothetical protein PAPHI01_0392 [Pancytospora philotis]|nr:hypothetical protein PAPHI01_0392 [Pancytospora philotis]